MADGEVDVNPRRWHILSVTLAAGFMTLLDITIVNVALPSIQRSLDASAASLQWVVSGYALTFGLTLVAGGRLGDLLGRRRMFLIGLTAFIVTSATVGAAPNEELLVAARLLQGVAAGLLTPQNSGLIQQLFTGEERGRAFGVFGATVGVSTAVGPVVGGLILNGFGADLGWRIVFLVNVPIGLVALALAARLIPRAKPSRTRLRSELDLVGALILGLAVLSVLLPVIQGEGDLTTWWWLILPLSPLFGVLFVRWERRVSRRGLIPVLDLEILRTVSGYRSGVVLGSLFFCGFGGIWLVLSLFFQNGLGYSPLETGLVGTPFALGSAVSAVFAGRLVERLDRWLTVAGLVMTITGLGVLAILLPVVPRDSIWYVAALPLLWAGVGTGAVISPNITMTLAHVPPSMGGAAAGALQTGQRIGTAFGAALLAESLQLGLAFTGGSYVEAFSIAMVCAVVLMAMALAVAVVDVRQRGRELRNRQGSEPASRRANACR